MRHAILCLAAVSSLLSLGCAISNYPVIFDSRGGWGESVLSGQYDLAYIVPSSQTATIYSDGSDELYTLVAQNWMGDQWLYSYNNYDPTAEVLFLDQTYCDPNRQTDCAVWTAWNPDLPDAYPHGSAHGSAGEGNGRSDDPFDGRFNPDCSGARSLSLLLSPSSRVGECGSGVWADKQAAALEFSLLETTTFRGRSVYSLPIDGSVAAVRLTGQDGMSGQLPIFGRFEGYLDQDLRLAFQMTPNIRYQKRALGNWIDAHGSYVGIDLTYGGLTARFDLNVQALSDRL